ncbi:family 43 glycosylhydrolase [Paenibacillus allorhizosphaerae]|uniref:Glycoside hydrolase n=1 Tax=Paenibacillus allorhizosphaerae TaxID=2849866 RepID=A0ABM8VDD7_9BACL|nr:family 43 glycosylhydrolase [Paenibacillus allorhizosphaerae]CAG7627430.1 hypothetical protein PAECIP111802_01353 [Paenibacillus allorhizosphaerae]
MMMYFADTTKGRPFSKDPAVVKFKGSYYMYYSINSPKEGKAGGIWGIGIAISDDLTHWRVAGEIYRELEYEANGFCAPGAIVKDGQIHLFYQTYGNGAKDAICHAVSEDGLHFCRNASNPIFSPTGEWNNGRAIDADVIRYHDKYYLYFATRDPKGEIQMLGAAFTEADSDFGRDSWVQACSEPILRPELPWEGKCIEAAAVCVKDQKVFMFYAGNYNNMPQQIGCAVSRDGIHFRRISDFPFLTNGEPGDWNSSESGHPFLFKDEDDRTYLFYQGNNDNGKTWYISKVEIGWQQGRPFIIRK